MVLAACKKYLIFLSFLTNQPTFSGMYYFSCYFLSVLKLGELLGMALVFGGLSARLRPASGCKL